MNHYDTLGVPKDADDKTIKRAYRKAAQQHHPDKSNGGDVTVFHAIQKAYDTLSDGERRQRYDATGDDSIAPEREQQARAVLAQIALSVIDQSDIDYHSLVDIVRSHINANISNLTKQKSGIEHAIAKRENALRRLVDAPLLAEVIQADIQNKRTEILKYDDGLVLMARAMEIIEKYGFTVDERPTPSTVWFTTTSPSNW